MTTYKDAGVDIDLANKSLDSAKKHIKSTFNKNTISDLGAFGGCYLFPKDEYSDPVLVSSTDGVGTKLKIAFLTNRHDTIGQCLVNHCVNDILVLGAKPLFFLDYFAAGKLNSTTFNDVIAGMSKACKENKCVLIAGETAEMPGFYNGEDYDLSGTVVGVANKQDMLSNRKIKKGDILIGLHSTGLHTNGYSLARKVLLNNYSIDDVINDFNKPLGEILLSIHKSYLHSILPILDMPWLHGISHITGGGIIENTTRILPSGQQIEIDWRSWETPLIFDIIENLGSVPKDDMRRSFNMGIGMILVVDKTNIDDAIASLKKSKEDHTVIGEIV
tara:strand:+ start:730 stop:1722 length:993 start_codon:yes stop_codon:yes gene_type:complete